MKKHRHDDPAWGDEVVRRYIRRRDKVQQREKAWADLKAAVEAEILEPISKAVIWVQGRFSR